MNWTVGLKNRLKMPLCKVLICEDDIDNQVNLISAMRRIFEPQGTVEIDMVAGAISASHVLSSSATIRCIILDHDMSHGNGIDLIRWMGSVHLNIPVITASGIGSNNAAMAHECHIWAIPVIQGDKSRVINGEFDEAIRRLTC